MTRPGIEPLYTGTLVNTNGDLMYVFLIFLLFHSPKFFTPSSAAGLSLESKRQRVSLNLMSIPSNLNNSLVSIIPLIFHAFNIFSKSLVTIISTTIGVTVTVIFHNFFSSLARYRYWSIRFLSFLLCGRPNSPDDNLLYSCKLILGQIFCSE